MTQPRPRAAGRENDAYRRFLDQPRPATAPGASVRRPTGPPGASVPRPATAPGASVRRPTGPPGASVPRPTGPPGASVPRPATAPGASVRRPTGPPGASVPRPTGPPGASVPRPTGPPGASVPRPATAPGASVPRPATAPGASVRRPTGPRGASVPRPAGAPGAPIPRPAGAPVASVARAVRLLEELRDSEQSLGVNELARRIGVNPSTASRLLATLERPGLVQREGGGQGPYRLGLALVTLADRVLARLDLQALARPVLVELMESTGETSTLSLPGEREAITVDSAPSRSSVVSMARLGRPSIAHATAVGKVMLAFGGGPLPRERDLTALTDRTITDRAELATAIVAVRQRGYATVFGERDVDVNAIAAPVFDREGALAAILGLQGPASRLADPTRVLDVLLRATATLTRALGGTATPSRSNPS